MNSYQQFTQALEISVKHNIKLSHISSLVSKGYNRVEFLQSGSGVLTFRFFGKNISTAPFKSRDSFYEESKSLVSQEPLAYAILNSCIDAENSTIDLGIPQTDKVIIEVSCNSAYSCTINVPRGTREKTSLSATPDGNCAKFKLYLEGYLDEKLRKSHIEDALSKGFRFVELDVFANGRLKFIFGGEDSFLSSYNSLKEFYQRSERLDELEGLGYALVDSCVDADKSTTKGVPSSYKIVIHITDAEVFRYKVAVPQS